MMVVGCLIIHFSPWWLMPLGWLFLGTVATGVSFFFKYQKFLNFPYLYNINNNINNKKIKQKKKKNNHQLHTFLTTANSFKQLVMILHLEFFQRVQLSTKLLDISLHCHCWFLLPLGKHNCICKNMRNCLQRLHKANFGFSVLSFIGSSPHSFGDVLFVKTV